MNDLQGFYARLCAWATRIGCSDEHVHGFAQRVCEAGMLNQRDRWPELLTEYLLSEHSRTGETIRLNIENSDIQKRMRDTADKLFALYPGKVQVTVVESDDL